MYMGRTAQCVTKSHNIAVIFYKYDCIVNGDVEKLPTLAGDLVFDIWH